MSINRIEHTKEFSEIHIKTVQIIIDFNRISRPLYNYTPGAY